MSRVSKQIALVLAGVWLTASFLAAGCAPKKRALEESPLDTPEHHMQSGMKLLEMEKYDDAMREFELANGLDPEFSAAYVGIGLVHGSRGDFKIGIEQMDKAASMAKTDEEKIGAELGFIRLYSTGKESLDKHWLKKAKQAYKSAVDLAPGSSAAHYYMAEAYKEALNFEMAGELFKKVLDINEGYVVEANDSWKLIQKIERAAPGTMTGRKIALAEQITRADVAALFVQELELDKVFANKKEFDASYKIPDTEFVTERAVKTEPALDIADHVLRTDIEAIIELGIKGLEPYPDHTFRPDQKVTRAEYAMMIEDILIRATGDKDLATKFNGSESPFPDLRNDLPYFNAVMVGITRGIMEAKDMKTGEFDPMGLVAGSDSLLIIQRLRPVVKR